MRPLALAIVLLLLSVGRYDAVAGPGTMPDGSFSVKAESGGWSVRYVNRPMRTSTVEIGGIRHIVFGGATSSTPADSGLPQLPVEVLSLGLPPGAGVTADVTDQVYEETVGPPVAPAPAYRTTDEGEVIAEYRKNNTAYSQNRHFPGREFWTDPQFTLRAQRISTIRLAPLQYNPARGTLRRLVSCTIHVRLSGGASPLPVLAPEIKDPFFEDIYRTLISNYEQAKQWRVPFPRPAGIAAEPSRDWFVTGREYYRIPVAIDGWYHVTRSDLAAAGALPGSPDTSTAALFYRGVPVPVVIRPDSSIEFHAERNRGDSTYFDHYTDTSSYWLTWGAAPGMRFSPSASPGGMPSGDISSATDLRHFELNTDYYPGTGDSEITVNGTVPGEGWVWEYYYPGSVLSHSFSVDSLDTPSSSATIRVRLYSTTPNFATPNHLARFWVNDSLLGTTTFPGRQEGRFEASFPARWLVPGTNILKIQSDPPSGMIVNQFYLDWFEIEYNRLLRATADQLVFASPASSGGGVLRFTVSGFTSPAIEVFDLVGRRQILGGVVTGDSAAGYAVAFQDSFSTARRYVVVATGGVRNVLPVSGKMFKDIRANATGADYIIVSHRDFLPAAQQLAAHRQSINGVRTTVVDVQDIYDEFNYGTLNAEKIKEFLRYAFTQWPGPPPTYLLMFGDASWDFHRYKGTTIKSNFVPAYGVPAGDNWFGCFDTNYTFLPSLLIGRIPAQDPLQAQRTVAKLIAYDSAPPAEWTKSFLFISGGTTPAERLSFNATSDATISQYVSPPSIGGYAYRVYKSTPNTIDGENRQLLKDIVKKGVVFLNFLGHSGGRIWGVDIGSPNDLENTNGRLPFVSSVSCNVGAFAEPSNNVLSEDFVLADNRGAIGMWASSSLGYASIGSALVNYFLSGVAVDTLRGLGALTTTARYRLWQGTLSNYVTVASVNLNPLLGDPLTQLAIPRKPDLAVASSDLSLSSTAPTPNDSALTVSMALHNYGLVPTDSVTVLLTDEFSGNTVPLLNNVKRGPTRFKDSLTVPWHGTTQIGTHTMRAILDPAGAITEVTEANNSASVTQYVYANTLAVIRPLRNTVLPPGPQVLRVSSPIGADSASMQVIFELDSVPSFNSSMLQRSGPVGPGPVSAEWTTPSLPDGSVWFWRARTETGSVVGSWTVSSFIVSITLPTPPLVRWREAAGLQFAGETLRQAAVTDSGVTISPNVPIRVFAQSLGYRADANRDYYTVVGVNDQWMSGYWWVNGSGFLALRVDEFTGSATFRAFDVPNQPAQADSMTSFLSSTPNGNYLALAVIFDGRSNVGSSLRTALKLLGSNYIDSLQPGHAWSLIARKGGGGQVPVEQWSPDGVTRDSVDVPNFYSYGLGSITTSALPAPHRWGTFRWTNSGVPGTTDQRAAIIGTRSTGPADTLLIIPAESTAVSLASLDPVTRDPAYVGFRVSGILASRDALVTPVLREWSLEFEPPADLAISPRTVARPIIVAKQTAGTVDVQVHNSGYRAADSARVLLSLIVPGLPPRPVASAMVGTIAPDGFSTVSIPFPLGGLPRRVTLEVKVSPPASAKDLVQENNVTLYEYQMTGSEDTLSARVHLFADGVQLMDGDYVAAQPRIVVRVSDLVNPGVEPPRVDLFVDNMPAGTPVGNPAAGTGGAAPPPVEPEFRPALSIGLHELRVRLSEPNTVGGVDSLVYRVSVNVDDSYRILQLFNYPNPFARETWFTFVLTGARPPDELTIRIFTVAGRRIREILAPGGSLQVGFNRVYWDGRDEDGEEVANGYYFYKIAVKGNDRTETAIGKLAKVR
ncbi:MAG: C25 family cysteine peptidase [Bacteroidota bacterium]